MRNPNLCSQREQRDAILLVKIKQVWDMNFRVYGARKVWHALRRQQGQVARCTVERLMARRCVCLSYRGLAYE